eukprot:m.16746 g.16746  ORF g.16746 m.16746 type:complete len:505 (+) comp3531_c0_seq1:166-1680(+)
MAVFLNLRLAVTVGRSYAIAVARRGLVAAPRPPPLVVQKYGGTSLGTAEKLNKVLRIVEQWHAKGRVVAVVSALSSETKSEGTTSCLLAAAEAAVSDERRPFQGYLDRIRLTHDRVIDQMLKDPTIRDKTREWVDRELDLVSDFCRSLQVIRELSVRSHDMIIGCGERLSAGVVSGVLQEHGIPSVPVNLSNVFAQELDTSVSGYHHLAVKEIRSALQPILDSDPRIVPVCTGYVGTIAGGIINGVGRGYSDLTAALVSAATQADAMQVWKESDGIFTGNPTKIEKARLVHRVTPEEAANLTYFGNEVLHPFTMECAIGARIPIHILNTFKPESPGTIVDPDAEESRSGAGITAIASKKGIITINLVSNRMLGSHTYLARVFDILQRYHVKVDLISATETNLSLTVHETISRDTVAAVERDLSKLGTCTITERKAIVSAIGTGMKHQVGLAAKMFGCLADAGINFEMIAQGASELNMSVVIDEKDSDAAIHAVHSQFLEKPSDE